MQEEVVEYLWVDSYRRRRVGNEEGRNKGEGKRGGVMRENVNNQRNLFTGLIFGVLVGGLVSIFFASKSGLQLRSKIKEKGAEVLKEAEEIILLIWVDTFFRLHYTPIET